MSKSAFLNPEGLSIAKHIAADHGLTLGAVRSPIRSAAFSRCRKEIAHALADQTSLSLPDIGAIINRDHTTVLHAIWSENARQGVNVRGMGANDERRDRNRVMARVSRFLSREVHA